MFSWLIESIVSLVVEVMEFLAQLFLDSLGNDLSTFLSLLPNDVIQTSFTVMQGLGIGLVIIVISWQLFKSFGLPIGIEAENPVQIAWKSALAILCIIFSWQIFNIGFSVINAGPDGGPMAAINAMEHKFAMQEVFSLSDFSGKFNALASTMAFVASAGTSTVMMVVAGAMIVIILFNLIKLLLELLERYCLLGVLALTSPLGFSAMCSAATSNIFRAWVRMCVGQYIMLLLNIWSVRIFIIMAGNGMNSDNFIVWMFFLLAFAKLAQKMDTYMQRLGLEVGSTGSSLLGELVAVRAVASGLHKGGGSTMGAPGGQGGIASRGAAAFRYATNALNLSGTGVAAAQGMKSAYSGFMKEAVASQGGTVSGPVKMMAGAMAMSGAVRPVATQIAQNILRNNLISQGISGVKYQAVKSQFDSLGAAGSSVAISRAVDTNVKNGPKQIHQNIASKMMNDNNRIYNDSNSCLAAGRAIFGDSIGSYNLTDVGNGAENATMGNGAFKFDNPATNESVTVMKSDRVTQQMKNQATSMFQQGGYSVITQPMHSFQSSSAREGGPTVNPTDYAGSSMQTGVHQATRTDASVQINAASQPQADISQPVQSTIAMNNITETHLGHPQIDAKSNHQSAQMTANPEMKTGQLTQQPATQSTNNGLGNGRSMVQSEQKPTLKKQ